MPIWYIHIYQISIQNNDSRSNEIFKGLPTVFGIAGDILITGHDVDNRD